MKFKVKEEIAISKYEYVNGTLFETGKIYLEPNMVYDCPKHGDEHVKFIYSLDDNYLELNTISILQKNGLITLSD